MTQYSVSEKYLLVSQRQEETWEYSGKQPTVKYCLWFLESET